MRWRGGRRTFVPALLVACIALAGVALASPAGAADTPTPDQLVTRAKKAAARPGHVLHTTTSLSTPTVGQESTVESWIDVPNRRLRQQADVAADSASPNSTPSAALVVDGQFHIVSTSGEHPLSTGTCPVSGLTASLLELCGASSSAGQRVQVDRTVVGARLGGHRAWKLTTTTASKTKGYDIHSTIHTWFDERTALPLASDIASTVTHQAQAQRERVRLHETSGFVPAGSLPTDFFSTDSVTAWLKAQPDVTPAFDPRLIQRDLTELGSGVASDGTRWTLSDTGAAEQCYVSISVGSGSGGTSCNSRPDPRHLLTMTNQSSGGPAFAVLTAPRSAKVVEVVARHGNHGRDVAILNSDPIRGSTRVAYFVVELPEGAHNVRSARVIR